MATHELIEIARNRGVQLKADGDKLVVGGHESVLTPEMLKALKAQRDAVLSALRHGVTPALDDQAPHATRDGVTPAANDEAPSPASDFAALNVEVHLNSPAGEVWLVPELRDPSRIELTPSDMETLRTVHESFPAARATSIRRAKAAPLAPRVACSRPSSLTLRACDPQRRGHSYPVDGDYRFREPVTQQALAEIRRVETQALAAGWSEAQLYQNRGNTSCPSDEYGLVCYLQNGRRIGAVCAGRIELTCPDGHSLHFHRPAEKKVTSVGHFGPRRCKA